MKSLITKLESIRAICKEWHYEASGESFYAQHLLADRIQDPLLGFVDSIKEVCFLGNGILPPSVAAVEALVPCEIKCRLYDSLTVAIYQIEELSQTQIMQGELNLLGSISEHLMLSRGLLWRVLEGAE